MVDLKTRDGLKISSAFYKSKTETRDLVLLLHMLGRSKEDWIDFAKRLTDKYNVLAIDFRGHGDSDGDLASFTQADFEKFQLDIECAKEHVERIGKKIICIIGGSIGANSALVFGAENTIDRLVLLSPGLDYKGIKTEEAARKYAGKILLVASEDDAFSANSTRKLFSWTLAKKQMKIYQNAGHGTSIFKSTDLDELILNWLGE
ncbi:alpha/beta fold hydrolase [Candidatus Micrarchaeota archaeon]|nr:alpha/beta fold hydrolase [Candidatus Micrarchaeota archaeon]